MNQTVREAVQTFQPRYNGRTDAEIVEIIRIGWNSGDALFYLLFGRYQEMLHTLFTQEATAAMEFSDFMLELNMRLFNQGCAAVRKFDETKASFKTYLSRIAHNLLFDLRKKEKPTLECTEDVIDATFDDGELVMQLIDAINSYTDGDARYVLFKVIEGYKSKEIALMLSSRRHEEGTLDENETLKPSYIDTIRSRALRNIRKNIIVAERKHEEETSSCSRLGAAPIYFSISKNSESHKRISSCSDAAPLRFSIGNNVKSCIFEPADAAYTHVNPFLEGLRCMLLEIV